MDRREEGGQTSVGGEKSMESTKREVAYDTEDTWTDGHHRERALVQERTPHQIRQAENSFPLTPSQEDFIGLFLDHMARTLNM